MKIYPKTAIILISASIIPLTIISLISYILAEKTITEEGLLHLQAIANIQKHRVEEMISRNKERLDLITSRIPMRVAMLEFMKTGDRKYLELVISALSGAKEAVKDIKKVYILSLDGRVVASTDRAMHGADHSGMEYFTRGKGGYSLDLFSSEAKGEVRNYISAPIYHEGKAIGVMVAEVSFESIAAITKDYTGLGKTGESLLAKRDKDGDALYIVPLRFDPRAALQRKISKRDLHVSTTQALLKNERASTDEIDYRGNVITLVLILACAFYAARSFTRPIVGLTLAAKRISEGDLSVRAMVTSTDEIGDLERYFNKMAEELIAANVSLEQRVKNRTAQLEAANKELEAFSYSVSHDLRAPLRSLSGFGEMLAKRAAGTLDEKNLHYLNVITESAKQMGRLIDELLSFSRMGRAEMMKTVVNIDRLVKEAVQELEAEVKQGDMVWEFGQMPDVYGDPSMLKQVVINLVSNALKFSRTRLQAKIEIGCIPDGQDEITFYVKDNGVGFDMQYANKLFSIFQRLHRQDEFEGTGIGLANVKRIIQRHGGRVWAEGRKDEGATFFFSLPKNTKQETQLVDITPSRLSITDKFSV
ncbi:MAG: sensor histidine kinase [Deltaproteobacteria bacterium]|nr:sensor histidine kinase [Deltaproteobacteria bacterium]